LRRCHLWPLWRRLIGAGSAEHPGVVAVTPALRRRRRRSLPWRTHRMNAGRSCVLAALSVRRRTGPLLWRRVFGKVDALFAIRWRLFLHEVILVGHA
jgi:hypothetical protein